MNTSLTEIAENKTSETLVNSSEKEETNIIVEPKEKIENVIERLKEINSDPCNADKNELASLKQNFYKAYKTMQDNALKKFVEDGGSPESFVMPKDNFESEFKEVMSSIKDKRNEMLQEEEQKKEENLRKKIEIIERMKELSESPEEANKSYNEFKKLQQDWKEIKLIPQAKATELWKSYQIYAEKFYDIIKLNNEFREYDFKKNLEIKTRICELAEKLADEPDIISAFHQLQKLHQEFRETGPVSKDLREGIWNRFKAASTQINKLHQEHFEELKEKEQRNLDEKTVICEIVETMEYDSFKTFQDWENKTQEILALQAKWKTIGYAPKKMNVKIFERFRSACDDFFKKKGEFFKSLKENMSENLEKKKALCEKAEFLKDSKNWKETAAVLTELQKEWKTIGPVAKKHSDAIWKRFISACDFFFDEKNKANSSKHSVEYDNMDKKKAIIEKLNKLNSQETFEDSAADEVKLIMKDWNNIGHVPFKEKDKLYNQYHAIIDELFKKLNISSSQKKLNNFKSNIENGKDNNLYREREKLVRAYESMRNEIQTYENNIGFLSSSSKKGNSLVTELNNKVERLRTELKLIIDKIAVIDNSLKEEKKTDPDSL